MADTVPTKQHYAAHQEIFRQGDLPSDAYLIERGKVEIAHVSGGHKTIVGYKQTGDIFGEMALIDHAPRMATVTAVEPTVCVIITAGLFKEHLDKATPLLKKVLTTFTSNLRSISERASGKPVDHS